MSDELDPSIVLMIAGEVTRAVTRREHPVDVAERIVADGPEITGRPADPEDWSWTGERERD